MRLLTDDALILLHIEQMGRSGAKASLLTTQGMAEALGMPYLTAYRHLALLREKGLVAAAAHSQPAGRYVYRKMMAYELTRAGQEALDELRDLLRARGG